MNVWLWGAVVLIATLVPLGVTAVLRGAVGGLLALQVAGTNATLAMLLIAEGTHRQPFASLALVLAVVSLIGTLALARYLASVD